MTSHDQTHIILYVTYVQTSCQNEVGNYRTDSPASYLSDFYR